MCNSPRACTKTGLPTRQSSSRREASLKSEECSHRDSCQGKSRDKKGMPECKGVCLFPAVQAVNWSGVPAQEKGSLFCPLRASTEHLKEIF